jgi:hypothetical protein
MSTPRIRQSEVIVEEPPTMASAIECAVEAILAAKESERVEEGARGCKELLRPTACLEKLLGKPNLKHQEVNF